MVDFDSETLFNAAAAVVATIAVGVFVLNVQFAYSPVSKVLITVAFLAGVFAVTQRTDDRQLTVLGYGVVVVSAVILFFDLVNTFDVDETLTVLGLLVVAGVLFWLRTRLDRESHFVSGSTATTLFGALAVLAVLVLVVDVATGGLAYELQTGAQVEMTGQQYEYEGQAHLGTVVVTNPTPLPERVEVPRYDACAAGNWSAYQRPTPEGQPERQVRVSLYVDDGWNDHVLSFGEKSYPVRLNVNGDASKLSGETFEVRRTDSCPSDDDGEPYVAVFVQPDDRYRYAIPA